MQYSLTSCVFMFIIITLMCKLGYATEVPIKKITKGTQLATMCILPEENCQKMIANEIKNATYFIAIEAKELSNQEIIKALINNKQIPKALVTNIENKSLNRQTNIKQIANKRIAPTNYIIIDGTTSIVSTVEFDKNMNKSNGVVCIYKNNLQVTKKLVEKYKKNRKE